MCVWPTPYTPTACAVMHPHARKPRPAGWRTPRTHAPPLRTFRFGPLLGEIADLHARAAARGFTRTRRDATRPPRARRAQAWPATAQGESTGFEQGGAPRSPRRALKLFGRHMNRLCPRHAAPLARTAPLRPIRRWLSFATANSNPASKGMITPSKLMIRCTT